MLTVTIEVYWPNISSIHPWAEPGAEFGPAARELWLVEIKQVLKVS